MAAHVIPSCMFSDFVSYIILMCRHNWV